MTATALLDEAPARNSALHPAAVENPHHARRWWILAVLGIAQLMVVLDATVVNIALPTAQHALGFSDNDRQWIVTAYALAFGSLLLIGGRLADLIGRKRMFLIGLAGFAVASADRRRGHRLRHARRRAGGPGRLRGAARAGRTRAAHDHLHRARERARAFGIYGAIAGAGAAVGLLLGGFLTEYASWRWTMYVNLIFAGRARRRLSLLLHRRAEHRPAAGLPGTLTVSGGLFALVYGFSHAETAGWSEPVTIGFLVAAGVLLARLRRIQLTSAHPLLPLRVVLDRNRGGAFFAMFTSAVGMFGVFLFLTYYLQQNQATARCRLASRSCRWSARWCVADVVLDRAATRVSPRILIPAGLASPRSACGCSPALGSQQLRVRVLPATLVMGVGMGLVFASAMSVATLGVRADDAGVASAAVNTVQQVGGSIGTALLNTIAATAATSYAASHAAGPAARRGAAPRCTATWSRSGGRRRSSPSAPADRAVLRPGVPQATRISDALVVV